MGFLSFAMNKALKSITSLNGESQSKAPEAWISLKGQCHKSQLAKGDDPILCLALRHDFQHIWLENLWYKQENIRKKETLDHEEITPPRHHKATDKGITSYEILANLANMCTDKSITYNIDHLQAMEVLLKSALQLKNTMGHTFMFQLNMILNKTKKDSIKPNQWLCFVNFHIASGYWYSNIQERIIIHKKKRKKKRREMFKSMEHHVK